MIRAATYSDLHTLVAMAEEFFSLGNLTGTGLSCDAYSISEFMTEMLDAPAVHVFLVCEKGGDIIGAIGGGLAPWMFNRDQFILHEAWWFVPDRYRESSPMAAMSLLKEFRREGKRRGAHTMVLASTERPEAERVRKFYQKIGLEMKDVNYIGRI